MKSTFCFILILLVSQKSFARREHHSHEHGSAKISIAVVENKIEFDFDCPAADLVGFEYKPKTEDDKKKSKEAFEKLKDPNSLLDIAQANCKIKNQKIMGLVFDAIESARPSAEHSEVNVEYELECENIESLDGLKTTLFTSFNKIKKIDVQVLKNDKSFSGTLTKNKVKIPGF